MKFYPNSIQWGPPSFFLVTKSQTHFKVFDDTLKFKLLRTYKIEFANNIVCRQSLSASFISKVIFLFIIWIARVSSASWIWCKSFLNEWRVQKYAQYDLMTPLWILQNIPLYLYLTSVKFIHFSHSNEFQLSHNFPPFVNFCYWVRNYPQFIYLRKIPQKLRSFQNCDISWRVREW